MKFWKWFRTMANRDQQQFLILDSRLIDIQGRLHRLRQDVLHLTQLLEADPQLKELSDKLKASRESLDAATINNQPKEGA